MTSCKTAAVYLLLLLTLGQNPLCVTAGKILIWPGGFSHWLNIKVIIEELIARGHNVTIVTHSAAISVKTTPSPGYNVDVTQVPHTKQDIVHNLEKFVEYWTYELANDNVIQASMKIKKYTDLMSEHNEIFCRNLFGREDLMEKWHKEEFDVLVTDPVSFCGELLAQKLNLPFVVSLRFSFGSVLERLCGQLPTPPSYVPGVTLGYTDQMQFSQRLRNFLFYFFQDIIFHLLARTKWDKLFTEIMGK